MVKGSRWAELRWLLGRFWWLAKSSWCAAVGHRWKPEPGNVLPLTVTCARCDHTDRLRLGGHE